MTIPANKKWLITIGSFVLFVICFLFASSNFAFTAALAISISLHELGHYITLRQYGLKASIVFIPFLGAAVIPEKTEYFLGLTPDRKAAVALNGIWVTVFLLYSCMLLQNIISWDFIYQMFYINLLLCVINICPIGPFDGAKIASEVVKSISSWKVRGPILAYLATITAISLLTLFGGLHVGVWLYILIGLAAIPALLTYVLPGWDFLYRRVRTFNRSRMNLRNILKYGLIYLGISSTCFLIFILLPTK